MGDETTVRVDVVGPVARVVLRRPQVLNALGVRHVRELIRVFMRAWHNRSVRSIVVTGEGRGFCAGHDLAAGDLGAAGAESWNDLFTILHDQPKPVVASVNGVAAGGGLHLALACDLAYVVDDAKVGDPFVKIGACADTGGHLFLPRSIGHQRAAELLLLGDMTTGEQATRWGLFNGSFPSTESLDTAVMEVANRLAAGPPLSQQVTRRGLEFARRHSQAEVLAWEAAEEERMARSWDMREGVAAFADKRAPQFRGE